jgi:ankyrin repeat protein
LTAADKKDEEAVLALLATGYKDLKERDGSGSTALINSSRLGMYSSVKALLSKGADKDARNNVSGSDACDALPYG